MSVNKAILIGIVSKEPEVRHFDNGSIVATFTLETTERGYISTSGIQVPDRREWHNIVLWEDLAEITEKYIHKDFIIYIEGKIHSRYYIDNQAIKRYITEVWTEDMQLISKPEKLTYPTEKPKENRENYTYSSNYKQRTYDEHSGSYAQDVMGYDDETINDAFEGDPDAYWNID